MIEFINVDGENYEISEGVIRIIRPFNSQTLTMERPSKIRGWVRFKTKDLRGASKLDLYRKVT